VDPDGRHHHPRTAQDGVWVDLVAQAEALNRAHSDSSLEVRAVRRHRLWDVRDGLEVADHWTDVFEPTRRRRRGVLRWRDVATVEQAATRIMEFLQQRPDLR
jgi:hypothetical protein